MRVRRYDPHDAKTSLKLKMTTPAIRFARLLGPLLLGWLGSACAAPAAHPIFVLNSLDASVSVIDSRSFEELRRIPTGKEPQHLYLTPDRKSLIVANSASHSLALIDPASGDLQRMIHGVSDPYYLQLSPDMKWLVTASNRLDRIDVYRWDSSSPARPVALAGSVKLPGTPSHLFVDGKSRVVYVSLQGRNELVAIELASRKLLWRLAVGKSPADVYLTPEGSRLFVALSGGDQVEVYDMGETPPRLVQRIPTGAGAHAFRARGDGRQLFVSNRVANTISIIDTHSLSVVETLPAPGGPDCIEFLADGKTLLVTSRWAGKLSVIDIDKRAVMRQVRVGRSPHDVWTLDQAPR
jgi:YVTN family beta-propeller protein